MKRYSLFNDILNKKVTGTLDCDSTDSAFFDSVFAQSRYKVKISDNGLIIFNKLVSIESYRMMCTLYLNGVRSKVVCIFSVADYALPANRSLELKVRTRDAKY